MLKSTRNDKGVPFDDSPNNRTALNVTDLDRFAHNLHDSTDVPVRKQDTVFSDVKGDRDFNDLQKHQVTSQVIGERERTKNVINATSGKKDEASLSRTSDNHSVSSRNGIKNDRSAGGNFREKKTLRRREKRDAAILNSPKGFNSGQFAKHGSTSISRSTTLKVLSQDKDTVNVNNTQRPSVNSFPTPTHRKVIFVKGFLSINKPRHSNQGRKDSNQEARTDSKESRKKESQTLSRILKKWHFSSYGSVRLNGISQT